MILTHYMKFMQHLAIEQEMGRFDLSCVVDCSLNNVDKMLNALENECFVRFLKRKKDRKTLISVIDWGVFSEKELKNPCKRL